MKNIKYLFFVAVILILSGCGDYNSIGPAKILPKTTYKAKQEIKKTKYSFDLNVKNDKSFKRVMNILVSNAIKRNIYLPKQNTYQDSTYSKNSWFKITPNSLYIEVTNSGYIKSKESELSELKLGGWHGVNKYYINLPMEYTKIDDKYSVNIYFDNIINIIESIDIPKDRQFKYSAFHKEPDEFVEDVVKVLEMIELNSKFTTGS